MLWATMLASVMLSQAAAPSAQRPANTPEQIEAPTSAIGLKAIAKNDKLVCRKEQLLGSRMFKTVCTSKLDAEQRRIMDQNATRTIQNNSYHQ
jgi:hypothetical protein